MNCTVQHRTWAARARCEWPWVAWVIGDGQWASVRTRRAVTVMLFGTRAEAQQAKAPARTGCDRPLKPRGGGER